MSELGQQFLSELNASQTVSFRNRPRTTLLWALLGLSFGFVCVFMLFIGVNHSKPTSLLQQLSLIPSLMLSIVITIYNFKQYVTRPTIIALSYSGLDYLGVERAWSDVSSVHIVGSSQQVLSIVLNNGLKTKVQFYGFCFKMNKIPILVTSLEYPQEFIECINACVGDKYKGLVPLREARQLDRL